MKFFALNSVKYTAAAALKIVTRSYSFGLNLNLNKLNDRKRF